MSHSADDDPLVVTHSTLSDEALSRMWEYAEPVYLGASSKEKNRGMRMGQRAHKARSSFKAPTERVVVNRLTSKRSVHRQWTF